MTRDMSSKLWDVKLRFMLFIILNNLLNHKIDLIVIFQTLNSSDLNSRRVNFLNYVIDYSIIVNLHIIKMLMRKSFYMNKWIKWYNILKIEKKLQLYYFNFELSISLWSRFCFDFQLHFDYSFAWSRFRFNRFRRFLNCKWLYIQILMSKKDISSC